MELTWESIYVKIIMLKTVITNENGYGGTLKGVLFSSLHSSQAASKSWSPLSFSAEKRKGGIYLNPKNVPPVKKPENKLKRHIDCGRILYTAFLCMCMASMLCLPAFAAGTTIWTRASEVMKDVYTQVLGISTIAAVVTAAVALLMMNFSRSGRTVDESRAWLKRIIVTWIILNSLGFIMSYVTPFFSGGQYTP